MPHTWANGTVYYSVVETSALVRAALKRAFPGVRFGVTSNVYSGGGSVNVRVPADGPDLASVHHVVDGYAGGDFDGTIDMSWNREVFLDPEGNVRGWDDPGSMGSGGRVPGQHDPQPAGTVRARLGANFVFVEVEW